ncbi:MAG: T9SS type A sorting domain-containing protein [Bacteroidota bacterium]|nr:T9SS type A sorting domain-containing protein [Bacteroidota bacterium]
MKKFLLLFLFLASFPGLRAQAWVYHPFPTDSATWSNDFGNVVFPTGMPPSYYIEWQPKVHYCMGAADTVIGANTYSQLFFCDSIYKGGIRDDNGKIYFVDAGTVTEMLIYDYSKGSGDTVTVYYQTTPNSGSFSPTIYSIGTVDSVLINGSFRRRMRVEEGYWIEGVGGTNGLFVELWPNVSNYTVRLICMSHNDFFQYPTDGVGTCPITSQVGIQEKSSMEEIVLYPNPTNGKFILSWKTPEVMIIDLYDFKGIRLQSVKTGISKAEVDLTLYPEGLYLVNMWNEQGVRMSKRVVKK